MNFERDVGFIFDIDGVVVDSPHEQAWRITAQKPDYGVRELSSEFYSDHVASRPRYEGANNILEKKGVYERLGAATEAQRKAILEKYCEEKNALIRQLIEDGKFEIFNDAVAMILEAKGRGVKQAAVSASKNAGAMLKKIDAASILRAMKKEYDFLKETDTLFSVFDVDSLGLDMEKKLDMIRFVSEKLSSSSAGEIKGYVVFEDAPMGMKAGKELGMFCVGIQRIGSRDALLEAGADIVVKDLSELPYEELKAKFLSARER